MGVITNTVTVTSGTPDPDLSNNAGSEDTAVCNCASLDDECNRGVCDPATGGCTAQPINEGGVCDDGDACMFGETCTAGTCGGGYPQDCSGYDDQCNVGVCNPGTGACESQPTNEGAPCDDGTGIGICIAGVCEGPP